MYQLTCALFARFSSKHKFCLSYVLLLNFVHLTCSQHSVVLRCFATPVAKIIAISLLINCWYCSRWLLWNLHFARPKVLWRRFRFSRWQTVTWFYFFFVVEPAMALYRIREKINFIFPLFKTTYWRIKFKILKNAECHPHASCTFARTWHYQYRI